MWNLSGAGIKPVFPALPVRFWTTGPPGKFWVLCQMNWLSVQFGLVQLLTRVQLLRPQGLQHARPPCPSPTPGVCSNSCPLSRWWHPAISSSVVSFSSCLQSLPALGSFPMSWFFTSSGQSTGVSASTSVLPMNIQDWIPLGLTGWISFLSERLLKSLLQHHSSKGSISQQWAFFMVQFSHPYMTTWKTVALTIWTLSAKYCLCFSICCVDWS